MRVPQRVEKTGWHVVPVADDDHAIVIERTLKTAAGVPLAILTSSDRDDDVAKSHRLGGNHFITKPSNPLELEAKLGALLRNVTELGAIR